MQAEAIQKLTEVIAMLFPVIISVVMIMLVVGIVMNMAGEKSKKGGLLILAVVFISALLLSASFVAATGVSVSPGSTSVYDGMPVTQTFRGLTDGLEYELLQIVGDEIYADSLYCDSSGILIVTVTPYRSGSNPFALTNVSDGDAVLVSFAVQNDSIMDYLIPIFIIIIMVSILSMILSIFTGKK